MRRLELREVVVDAVVGRDREGTALPDTATERLAEPLDFFLCARKASVSQRLKTLEKKKTNAQ